MKVYAILAHDKKDSLNSHIFGKIVEHLKSKNIEIDILNLYDYQDQIPFFTHDKEKLEANLFFQENKKRFLDADRILIVHPIYWFSVPGILKAWLDLITDYAYKMGKGISVTPLHKIKKLFVISTSGAPAWYLKFFTNNSAKGQLNNGFKFIGVKDRTFYQIGSIEGLNPDKLEKYMRTILNKIDKFVAE
jgi:putative NADPH-quinone reductase